MTERYVVIPANMPLQIAMVSAMAILKTVYFGTADLNIPFVISEVSKRICARLN